MTWVSAADFYFKIKDHKKAGEYWSKVLQKEPQCYQAYLLRGITYIRQYYFNLGLDDLAQAYSLNEQSLDDIVELVSGCFTQDPTIIDILKEMIVNNPSLRMLLLIHHLSENRYEEAEAILRDASLGCPQDTLKEKMINGLKTLLAHKKTKEKMSIRYLLNPEDESINRPSPFLE